MFFCIYWIFKLEVSLNNVSIAMNKEVLQMADIDNLSEDVRKRRWKFNGHIMRKEPNNDCRTVLT